MMMSTSFQERIGEHLLSAKIPGIALAILREGNVQEVITLGVRDVQSRIPVDDHTVFEAASLSKPVFSYAVLRMIDAGILSLDERLDQLELPDPRAARITVRHVLSHTSGLPNWRSEALPLRTYFRPGERFSYSGEAFVHLQAGVERKTGETLDGLADRLVFRPLRMFDSGYVWRESFESNYAGAHDEALGPAAKFRPMNANAAFSLHTTAGDYGRFLEAVLSGEGLEPATAKAWLEPVAHPPTEGFLSLEDVPPHQVATEVAWGLGWGLEPACGAFFHWGSNDHARAYAIGHRGYGNAFVAFMNSENGFSVVPDIASTAVPGDHPSFRWLGLAD